MINKRPSIVVMLSAALAIYSAFAGILFYPCIQRFSTVQLLFPVQTIIGALGVFVLSRRWVLSFFASLAGGAIFGFGTYACSFHCYHPYAGLVNALLPWCFIPAVFFYRWTKLDQKHTDIISGLLSLMPVLFVLVAYQFAALKYLYPIPLATALSPGALLGIIDPIGVKQDIFAPGFYHVTMAGLLMGIAVLIRTKRFWTIIIFAVAAFAAFYKPILNVPPVVWASIPIMFCSIIIASGLETIILAGASDGKWLLAAVSLLLLLSVLNVSLTGVFSISASLYAIGLISVLFIYFIAEAHLAWHPLRMLILYSAVFIDILISTRHVIDAIF